MHSDAVLTSVRPKPLTLDMKLSTPGARNAFCFGLLLTVFAWSLDLGSGVQVLEILEEL